MPADASMPVDMLALLIVDTTSNRDHKALVHKQNGIYELPVIKMPQHANPYEIAVNSVDKFVRNVVIFKPSRLGNYELRNKCYQVMKLSNTDYGASIVPSSAYQMVSLSWLARPGKTTGILEAVLSKLQTN